MNADLEDAFPFKQDWPVASELVPGGMHFHFCIQNNALSDPTIGPMGESVEITSSSGVSK